jgi:hypothetical protein
MGTDLVSARLIGLPNLIMLVRIAMYSIAQFKANIFVTALLPVLALHVACDFLFSFAKDVHN